MLRCDSKQQMEKDAFPPGVVWLLTGMSLLMIIFNFFSNCELKYTLSKFAEMAFDFVRISLYTDTARTAK